MNRRSFMAAILASAAAPAIVKAGSIMRVNPKIIASDSDGLTQPVLFENSGFTVDRSSWGASNDGVHDDTVAMQAWLDGKPVRWAGGGAVVDSMLGKRVLLSDTLYFRGGGGHIRDCTFEWTKPQEWYFDMSASEPYLISVSQPEEPQKH